MRTEFEGEPDPDGLSRENRLALEEAAISRILEEEPALQRTPTNNPGFDLYEADESGTQVRWVEVKAMSGDMRSRPATLTHTQFEYARKHGKRYWLYVVEHAGTDGRVSCPSRTRRGGTRPTLSTTAGRAGRRKGLRAMADATTQHDLLLRGGTLLDPAQGIHGPRDIAFRDGRVSAVAERIEAETAAEVVDVAGGW